MHVNFYATLRMAAGRKKIDVAAPAQSTVRAVLEAASLAYPRLDAELWEAPGRLFEYIHVFVNGREACYLPLGMETPLGPQDVLDVFPPIGGGASPDAP